MNAQDLRLDYYQIYDLENREVSYPIKAKGQFDRQAVECRLTVLDCLGSPVSKNKEPLYNKTDKLILYRLYQKTREPDRKVEVENQFGRQELIIGKPLAFLAPTLPRVVPIPPKGKLPQVTPKLGHYKVYSVLQGKAPEKQVVLIDEFGEYKTTVLYPYAFAVPVVKTIGRQIYPIVNEKAHLVFYKISPRKESRKLTVIDQFGRKNVVIVLSIQLAAPSLKIKWG